MQNFIIFPLVLVNVWHAGIIVYARQQGKPWASISEGALASRSVLYFHRLVHVAVSISYSLFALWLWALPGFRPAAVVLVIGAVFDVAQALALHKGTCHKHMHLHDTHQLTAWTMASGYLLFSVILMQTLGVQGVLIACYIGSLLLICLWSWFLKHRYFWLTEMLFFVIVATVVSLLVARISV